MSNYVVWTIFGILIAILIVFMVISFYKDKKKNKEIIRKKIELKSKKGQKSKELSVRINLIIEKNEIEVAKVIALNSDFKMKNVNFISKNLLTKIKKDKMFKLLYVNPEELEEKEKEEKNLKEESEMSKNLDILISTKSNMWSKRCKDQIVFFKKLDADFQSSEEYQKFYDSQKKDIEKVFHEAQFAK